LILTVNKMSGKSLYRRVAEYIVRDSFLQVGPESSMRKVAEWLENDGKVVHTGAWVAGEIAVLVHECGKKMGVITEEGGEAVTVTFPNKGLAEIPVYDSDRLVDFVERILMVVKLFYGDEMIKCIEKEVNM